MRLCECVLYVINVLAGLVCALLCGGVWLVICVFDVSFVVVVCACWSMCLCDLLVFCCVMLYDSLLCLVSLCVCVF